MKNRAVLVTGAAGCIGAWTVKLLTEMGANPIVYDLSKNRSRLHLIMDGADDVIWEQGNISDFEKLKGVIIKHDVSAIIHLAAVLSPTCKTDPLDSTRANIMGSINILEAARQTVVKRITYASSVAVPAMGDNEYLATLYGAHKFCGEQMAGVYWQDWQTPSIGIRPGIIYGPGRDQGMSAAPSIAMLAALEGKPYTIPFSGYMAFCHAEDAAQRFVAAISKDQIGAPVFDMNGTHENTAKIVELIKTKTGVNAEINFTGDAIPFPAEKDDGKLDGLLGVAPYRSLEDGITHTLACFKEAKERGIDISALSERLIA